MSLRPSQGELPEQPEQVQPTEQTEPALQHPVDQSWVLQILLDLKESVGRIDGRIQEQSQRIEGLAEELRTMRESMLTSTGARWLVSLVVAVILAIGGMIYREITRAPVQSNALPSNVPERTEFADPGLAQPPPSHMLPHEEQETSP